jgi:hypothetical protein
VTSGGRRRIWAAALLERLSGVLREILPGLLEASAWATVRTTARN